MPVGSVEDLTVAGRPARLYRPEGDGPWPTLVFLHGGGFVIGDLDTHDQTCRRICSGADTVVLAIDYRLAPEAAYPAAVEDALAAVQWAADHQAELGGGDLLAVGGDSAGGNLSAVAAQELPDLVGAQVLIYPATHVAGDYPSRTDNGKGYFLEYATMVWFFDLYSAGDATLDPDDPRVSPFFGKLEGVAPALVVTAEFDPLRDEGEAYADRLAEAGVRGRPGALRRPGAQLPGHGPVQPGRHRCHRRPGRAHPHLAASLTTMIATHHWDDWTLDDLVAAKGTGRSAWWCPRATRRRRSATW